MPYIGRYIILGIEIQILEGSQNYLTNSKAKEWTKDPSCCMTTIDHASPGTEACMWLGAYWVAADEELTKVQVIIELLGRENFSLTSQGPPHPQRPMFCFDVLHDHFKI